MKVKIAKHTKIEYTPKTISITFESADDERAFRHLVDCSSVRDGCPRATLVRKLQKFLRNHIHDLAA